jgi:ABC-2 type transport system permease protein
MTEALRATRAAARLEFEQLSRSRVLFALVVLEAITFLVLVSLFGLTGSRAPTALIDRDGGPLARSFVEHLDAAHHSFALRPMSIDRAREQISSGDILAIITIPSDFGRRVAGAGTSVVPITVDNVNEDLTGDVREAMPSAVTAFAADNRFPGVRVVAVEHDLIDHETGYVAYLVVSALALTAFVVAGILGAVSITREFETRTVTQWRLAPVPAGYLVVGKLLAASCVSAIAVGIAALIVVAGYGVHPEHVLGALGVLAICVVIFTSLGACIGALLRRTLPVSALFFGLALPFYVDSGALEPLRFDGEKLWVTGHASPVYSAIGVLQWSFHGLRVTPESVPQNVLVLCLWALAATLVAAAVLSRRVVRR